ncbi:hypothetical protein HCCG_00144 [Helicobacter cinaedi CCUG 18818 = ATCC BAA-847]|uniref:Uncharacterized protein n=1 Tax=Helicobacter cinaedi CCUG 18818 = ATCC BAA-847 TaxID=537971 RepID=A0ABN0B855_9HELI|nr:hypothetical protein HCCG_00144 [Helicobacter cinaedi CCUG 18818 = ATCC BAA-847]
MLDVCLRILLYGILKIRGLTYLGVLCLAMKYVLKSRVWNLAFYQKAWDM